MYNDLRFALRMLRKNPGFTAVAVLTLALGIGGTTAIFSVIQCAVLDPFPYADSHRLMVLIFRDVRQVQSAKWAYVSAPEFLDYKEQNQVFDEVIGATGEGGMGLPVTENFFRVLGVPPLIGRALVPDDGKPGAPAVVVLSYKVWQSQFGGDSGILGRTLVLNGRATTVIGVMPKRFTPFDGHLYLPATLSKAQAADHRQYFWLIGHLKPGVSVQQAAADVAVLSKRFAAVYAKDHPPEVTFGLESYAYAATGEFRKTLYILLGAVGLLLLIACVNVANLLLARATTREKEMAVRVSLGASRGRMVRQFLIESLLLALGGATLGCLIAWDTVEGLAAIIPPGRLPSEAVVRINGPALMFTLGLALLSTLLVGLVPALHAVTKDLQGPLKASGKGADPSIRHTRLRHLLVVGEVVLSLMLLTSAGLLIRSFFALHRIELGYDPERLLSVNILLPENRYMTGAERNQFLMEALRRVQALPGIVSAALGNAPLDHGDPTPIEIAGKTHDESWRPYLDFSGGHYFETVGILLLQGRTISEEDFIHARKVAVVNRAFVNNYLAGENPLGRQVREVEMQTGQNTPQPPWSEIVGVIADTLSTGELGPEMPTQPRIYFPYTVSGTPWVQLVVRTVGEPAHLVNSVQRELAAMNKELPLGYAATMQDQLNLEWFNEPRFVVTVLVAFASLGLALVCVGVYSVLSYAVSRRTQEIGIRMALGAAQADVRRMVIMSGLRWLLGGIAIGVPASIALAKILRNRIWGIKSADPLTLVAVSLVLILVGLAACYFPARRATKVDPLVALRYE